MSDVTKRVLCFVVMFINCSYAYFSQENFIKWPYLYKVLKNDFLLKEHYSRSILSCASKCSEKQRGCVSFAWNKETLQCLLYNRTLTNSSSSVQREEEWEHFNIKECSKKLENGTINENVNKAFTPGESLTGSCNEDFVAVSGKVTITCNSAYRTVASDACRQVLKTIAVDKPTEQSSTFQWYNSSLAVDGNRDTDIDANSCSHTNDDDDQPWWRVDLLNFYYIINVRMVNRGEDRYEIDTSYRLRNVTITTGETLSNISTLCGFYAGPGSLGELVTINCPPSTTGRYVKISLVTAVLTLCEVDVFVVPV